MFSSNSSQVSSNAVFVEEIFQTYLYTGNGTSQTITNGIDVSGKGALVWIKDRTTGGAFYTHTLHDTARGNLYGLNTASTDGQAFDIDMSFTSSGFSLNDDSFFSNKSGDNYVSWTFREQPKFFDVVTYTGTGSNTTIAHSLGSVPGSIIVKRTDTTAAWAVYHRSLANTQYMVLNTYAAVATGATWWNSTTPTSAVFSVGTDASVNASGGTYVAYLFAHDAGGFGLAGTDNVISCGIFTTDVNGGCNVNLGYEPQWILSKSSTIAVPWAINDTMRGFTSNNSSNTNTLYANSSGAEFSDSYLEPTSTGFKSSNQLQASAPYIYIACRRGPMKVPTLGTSVFSPIAATSSTGTQNTTNFPLDMQIAGIRGGYGENFTVPSRLTGVSSTTTSSGSYLVTSSTNSEATGENNTRLWDNIGFQTAQKWSGSSMAYWNFRRAPGFFDEVCYTGTGSARTQTHNLGVAPELAIVKDRNVGSIWYVQNAAMFAAYTGVSPGGYYCVLNTTAALIDGGGNYVYNPTASTISLDNGVNFNTRTYVAYLFATCAGVSKVGSYTGNGTTQTINCGFTGGARFVLIKRTDSTGDWYTYDTARGMTVLTDPYLLMNTTAAEVATLGSVTTVSTGFALNSTILAAINISAGTYIFLAIA